MPPVLEAPAARKPECCRCHPSEGGGHASCFIPGLGGEVESLDHGHRSIVLLIAAVSLAGCANGGPPPSTTGGRSSYVTNDGGSTPDATAPPASDCGNMGNPCCDGRCEGDLMCIDGLCGRGACGAAGEPCCDSAPQCFAGLTCTVDGCQMAGGSTTPCGALGQSCCAGSTPCDTGLSCQAGSCSNTSSADAGTPPPPADSGTPPPPPTGDPCADAVDCLDCTSRSTCGFCDGACVESDFLGPPGCMSYSWFTFECVL